MADPDAMNKIAAKYARQGHPSLEELMEAQGVTYPIDPKWLQESFWPEDDDFEQFLDWYHEQRGHRQSRPAA